MFVSETIATHEMFKYYLNFWNKKSIYKTFYFLLLKKGKLNFRWEPPLYGEICVDVEY